MNSALFKKLSKNVGQVDSVKLLPSVVSNGWGRDADPDVVWLDVDATFSAVKVESTAANTLVAELSMCPRFPRSVQGMGGGIVSINNACCSKGAIPALTAKASAHGERRSSKKTRLRTISPVLQAA